MDKSSKIICCLDVDAFFVSVELLSKPNLKNKAVVISGNNQRSVISTSNYVARIHYGIKSAMPLFQAKSRCPNLVILPPHFSKYHYFSQLIFQILQKFSSKIIQASIDEYYFEISLKNIKSTIENFLKKIQKEIFWLTNLEVTIGAGPNKVYAKLATKIFKPNGICILDKLNIISRIQNKSIRCIQFIGKQTEKQYNQLDIYTIKDLLSKMVPVTSSLSKTHEFIIKEIKNSRFLPLTLPKTKSHSYSRSVTWDKLTNNIKIINAIGIELLKCVVFQLLIHDCNCKTIQVTVKKHKFKNMSHQFSFNNPLNSLSKLIFVVKQLIQYFFKNDANLLIYFLSVSIKTVPKNSIKKKHNKPMVSQINWITKTINHYFSENLLSTLSQHENNTHLNEILKRLNY